MIPGKNVYISLLCPVDLMSGSELLKLITLRERGLQTRSSEWSWYLQRIIMYHSFFKDLAEGYKKNSEFFLYPSGVQKKLRRFAAGVAKTPSQTKKTPNFGHFGLF